MKNPTVSVVIPNYNHAHFLKTAIDSYLSQTVLPLEIIIVDDGSVDNSIDLIKKISETTSLIHLIQSDKNEGVNKTIQKGLAAARGDYVVFTAADDFVETTFLEKSLRILKHHPKAGFSFCDPAQFIPDNKEKRYYPLYLSDHPRYFSPDTLLSILKTYFFSFSSNTVIFNRELLIKSGGFMEDLELGADWFACFLMAFRHGACYVPECLAFATLRNDSYSAHGLKDRMRQKKTFLKILKLLNSDCTDVSEYFKEGAVVYEHSWRALFWILSSPAYYRYLSSPLFKRLLVRGTWAYLRDQLSPLQRDRLRKFVLKYNIKV